LSKPDEAFNVGEIVLWNGANWLIKEINPNTQVQTKGTIEQCNNVLKFYNKDFETGLLWELCQVPCIFQTPFKTGLGILEDKLISSAKEEYEVIIPSSINTAIIDIGIRFLVNNKAFLCEGAQDLVPVGLKTLKLTKTEFCDDDNKDLKIANYYSHQNTPIPEDSPIEMELTFIGADYIKIGQQSTYAATVTDDDVVSMRNVIWTIFADDGISSSTLATVIAVSGTYSENAVIKTNNNSQYGYIRLRCRSADGTCEQTKRIQIKSLI
jgi:hypothetical protein